MRVLRVLRVLPLLVGLLGVAAAGTACGLGGEESMDYQQVGAVTVENLTGMHLSRIELEYGEGRSIGSANIGPGGRARFTHISYGAIRAIGYDANNVPRFEAQGSLSSPQTTLVLTPL